MEFIEGTLTLLSHLLLRGGRTNHFQIYMLKPVQGQAGGSKGCRGGV